MRVVGVAVAPRSVLDAALLRHAIEDLAPAVHRYVVARVGVVAAEDVLAETFALAWRERHKFKDPSDSGLESWLIGIATHAVSRHRRAEGRWLRSGADAGRLLHDAPSFEDDVEAVDRRIDADARRRQLGVALARLDDRDRDPFLMHVLYGLSYAEIAQALDVSIGTVRSRISRGRNRLASRMRRGRDA